MKLNSDKKQIAVLIDPDKMDDKKLHTVVQAANKANIDFFW
ncbi:MAG: hypothetical protein R2807_09455 [Chitinophagales bacterium]